MNKIFKWGFLFVVGTAAAIGGFYFNANRTTPVATLATPDADKQLRAISLPDLNGKPQSIAQWEGKILVVNFWATWCSPCLKEIPDLMKIQQENVSNGVQIVGIALDSATKVQEFNKTRMVNYPLLIGSLEMVELLKSLGNESGALPFTLIFDRNGRVTERHLGSLTQAQLTSRLRLLL